MKQLWDKLAQANSKYYINSDKGKKITELEFRVSGFDDDEKLIDKDKLLENKNGTILEIGCGTGRMTEFLPMLYNKVIGIDISGEMIRQGKERLMSFIKGRKIKLKETDGYTIPLDDNSIDVAFSYLVFQHMKNKEMVESNLKEVYRVLKEGGIFKVRIRTDKVPLNKWWGGVNYNKDKIIKVCENIGYKIIKTKPVSFYGLWLWLQK